MDLTGMAETIHSVHNYFTLGGSINMERVKAFLKRKQVVISVQTYLIDALGAMAFGLFASLLIGTIFGTLGKNRRCNFTTIAGYAKSATGAALGVSIAYALKAPTLVLFSAATVGIAGNELGGRSARSLPPSSQPSLEKSSPKRHRLIFSSPRASPSSPVSWPHSLSIRASLHS